MERLDILLAIVGIAVCVYVWIVRPILTTLGVNLREPKWLTRLRMRAARGMDMPVKQQTDESPPVNPGPSPLNVHYVPDPVAEDLLIGALVNQAIAPQVRGPKPPPVGSSPWDAVFREWLAEQQDLSSSWYRRMEIPSGTVFVFVIPRSSEPEEEVIDPEKTERCPRDHPITERARQGSYCSSCAEEGHKYSGQKRPGVFKAADYTTTKSRRRYNVPEEV